MGSTHARRPIISASMYFAYNGESRPEIRSRTTFDAILAGERTSTTRFPAWPGYARWTKLQPGDVVRFYDDRAMRGRWLDVVVESIEPINLATCSAERLEAWSKAEGWSVAHGRQIGVRHGEGLQIRYRLA